MKYQSDNENSTFSGMKDILRDILEFIQLRESQLILLRPP
jgi:hypothetical protein